MAEEGGDHSNNVTSTGCCGWFKSEVTSCLCCCCCCCNKKGNKTSSTPMFGAVDPNGKTIDFDGSFQTGGVGLVIVAVKFIIWGLIVSTFILGFFDQDHAYFYLAYISYWTLAYSVVYQTFSLLVSFGCCSGRKDPSSSTWLIRATWVMYIIAAVHGLCVVLLFWITEYSPDYQLRYFLIMSHGVTFGLTVIDGLIINRIPVRLSHCWYVMALGILFVVWTIIQQHFIDNPNRDDEDGSENLYNILNWQDQPLESAIVCILVVFVAMPLFTILFWGLSLLAGRRYLQDVGHHIDGSWQKNSTEGVGGDEEHGASPQLEMTGFS